MIRTVSALLLAIVLVGMQTGQAGDDKKKGTKLGVGDAAPVFKDLPGVDGKTHSIGDYKKDLLVVVVTCNHCPVSVAYEDRIIELTKKHGKKVDVVAINVNNYEPDRLDKMVERAKEKGFNFPYLHDKSQKIGHALGAQVTPQFYVFDKNRKLAYEGAMDDRMNEKKVKVRYLEDALQALYQGKMPAVTFTPARGCTIGYDDE